MSFTQDPQTASIAETYSRMLESKNNLAGKSLVNNLTDVCLKLWYEMSSKFTSRPDVFDIHDDQNHDQFMIMKMSPGADMRDTAYEAVLSMSQNLSKALNKAFDKEVFETRISRKGGNLEVLVGFTQSKGGVFQCRAESSAAGSVIHLTMPNENELIRAFSAMTDTPHPDDVQDGLEGDESDLGSVAGEPIPSPSAAPASDVKAFDELPDEGGPNVDPESGLGNEPEEDEESEIRMRGEGTLHEGIWHVFDRLGKFLGEVIGSSKSASRQAREKYGDDAFEIKAPKGRILGGRQNESFSIAESIEYTDGDRKRIMEALKGFWEQLEDYIKDVAHVNETYSESGDARVYILQFEDSEDRLKTVTKIDSMAKQLDDELDDIFDEFGRSEYDSNFSSSASQFEGTLRATLGILDKDGLSDAYFLMKSMSARKIRLAMLKQTALQKLVKLQTAPFVAPTDDVADAEDGSVVSEPIPSDGVALPVGGNPLGNTAAASISRLGESKKVKVNNIQPKDKDGDGEPDEDEAEDEIDESVGGVSVSGGGISLPTDAKKPGSGKKLRHGRRKFKLRAKSKIAKKTAPKKVVYRHAEDTVKSGNAIEEVKAPKVPKKDQHIKDADDVVNTGLRGANAKFPHIPKNPMKVEGNIWQGDIEDSVIDAIRLMQNEAVQRWIVQYPDEQTGNTKRKVFTNKGLFMNFMDKTDGAVEMDQED